VAGVTLSGLSSGLDTDGIIQGLMQVEAAPRQQLVLKQSAAQARHDGLQQVLDKLNALKLSSDDLSSVLTWNPVQTVTPSDATKATARMISGAGPGSYSVNVTQLATAEQRTFAYTAPAADETYTLNGKSLTVTAGESVDAIAAAINADSTYGAYAVNAGGRLVMASRTTGAATTITLSGGAGALSEDASARKVGKDAAYSIDGTNYTSSTNTISSSSGATGFVFGVELNLTGTGSFTVSVSPPSVDKTAVTNTVKAFVDAYNSAVTFMQSKVNEKRVPNAQTAADAQAGALWSDDSVDQAMEDLRSTLATYTQGGSNSLFDQLNEIGISTGAASGSASFSQDSVNGKLVLDTTKLGAALDSDPAAVQRLLGGELGTGGFAQSFSKVLKNYVQTGGIFSSRIDAATTDIRDFADSIADMDTRLSQKQDQLRQMFTNMELALQKTKSQGTELLAKLGISSDS
jgi:flagellar hook-associated protein 2